VNLADLEVEAISVRVPESEGSVVEAIGRKFRETTAKRFSIAEEIPYEMLMAISRGGRDVDLVSMPQLIPMADRRYPQFMKLCVDTFGPFMVIQLSETWSVRCATEEEQEELDRWKGGERRSYEEHPNRTENVMLTMESRAGFEAWFAEILRPKGKPATLGEWTQPPKGSNVTGRIVGLMDLPN
jgi:hypothetical protein